MGSFHTNCWVLLGNFDFVITTVAQITPTQITPTPTFNPILIYVGLVFLLFVLMGVLIWMAIRFQDAKRQLTEKQRALLESTQLHNALQERINRLQRMESLGMLAGGVAHDFNNLLVGVVGNAEILENISEPLDEFSRERIRQIIASAEKAADLSRQMLAYAGKNQIQRAATDLNLLTKKMSRVLNATAGHNRRLEFELSSDHLFAKVDRMQIEQVLLNLVSNARQATDKNGAIVVRSGLETIANVAAESNLFGQRREGGEFVFFEVEDSGVGISGEMIGDLFDPFFTMSEQGSGVGLSVVFGIVNQHNGLVRVTSQSNQGSCFRILLPKVDASPSPEILKVHKRDRDQFESNQVTPGTLLVVDDEPSVIELVVTLLEPKGWEVLTAENGKTALAIALDSTKSIDCMLLNVVMPNQGAEDVLLEIDQAGIEIPVILMSGYSDTQLQQFQNNRNVKKIMGKPFREHELISAIAEAMNSQVLNHFENNETTAM